MGLLQVFNFNRWIPSSQCWTLANVFCDICIFFFFSTGFATFVYFSTPTEIRYLFLKLRRVINASRAFSIHATICKAFSGELPVICESYNTVSIKISSSAIENVYHLFIHFVCIVQMLRYILQIIVWCWCGHSSPNSGHFLLLVMSTLSFS